jgi:hypothetical protein
MKKLLYDKRLFIGFAVLVFILLLNHYSILLDFFLGILLIIGIIMILSVLGSQLNIMRMFKVLKTKYFRKVVR